RCQVYPKEDVGRRPSDVAHGPHAQVVNCSKVVVIRSPFRWWRATGPTTMGLGAIACCAELQILGAWPYRNRRGQALLVGRKLYYLPAWEGASDLRQSSSKKRFHS